MKSKLSQFILLFQRIDRRYIQMAFVLLALALLVLGASAPDDGGYIYK